MIINQSNLGRLFTGYSAAFQRGLGQADPQWNRVATRVPSTTREEKYAWLGQTPNLREWIGDRVIKSIEAHDYSIKNKSWESTIEVGRDDIEDDTYGVYSPLFEEMGRSTAAHPNQLVFSLLGQGFSTACYDGQYFFDTDHPVQTKEGVVSVSNTGGGSGAAWYLLDTSKVVKPIIFQQRTPFKPQELTSGDSDHVFKRNELLFGVDGRCNVGYGLWQTAYASKQTLDKTALWAARANMMGFKGDNGEPLGITPNLLLVPPSLEEAARTALEAVIISNTSNVMKGLMKVEVCPWLA